MNPLTRIPDPVRFWLYIIWGVGYPVMLYLKTEGYVGESEMDLFNGVGAFLGATAASNMQPRPHHSSNDTEEV